MKSYVKHIYQRLLAIELTYSEAVYLIAAICSSTRLTDVIEQQNVTASNVSKTKTTKRKRAK